MLISFTRYSICVFFYVPNKILDVPIYVFSFLYNLFNSAEVKVVYSFIVFNFF